MWTSTKLHAKTAGEFLFKKLLTQHSIMVSDDFDSVNTESICWKLKRFLLFKCFVPAGRLDLLIFCCVLFQ